MKQVNPLAWTKLPILSLALALGKHGGKPTPGSPSYNNILDRLYQIGYEEGEAQFLLAQVLDYMDNGIPKGTPDLKEARKLTPSVLVFLGHLVDDVESIATRNRQVAQEALATNRMAEKRLQLSVADNTKTVGDRLRDISMEARAASVAGAPLGEDALFEALVALAQEREACNYTDHLFEVAGKLLSPARKKKITNLHLTHVVGNSTTRRAMR